MAKSTKSAWVGHSEVMAKNLADPEFRYHYEQRLMVHDLALAVRSMRKAAKLTQAELAKRIGVKQPMIARIEKGIGQSKPNWPTLHRIALALNMQLKLSFMSQMPDQQAPLVEIDGKSITEIMREAGEEEARP